MGGSEAYVCFEVPSLVNCNIVKHRLAGAMKANAWVCALATDHDLESGLSEPTVILRVVQVRHML